MVDLRKELSLINKHVRQHGREAGLSVTWFEFLAFGAGSSYDDIYDEGDIGPTGRSYGVGIEVPVIYVNEIEDAFTASEDGRQPTQNIEVVILYQDALRAGITEPWEYQNHLNDMIYYDGRFFKVNTYRSRGHAPSDVLITVDAFEIYVDQDMVYDNPPEVTTFIPPFPPTFPVITQGAYAPYEEIVNNDAELGDINYVIDGGSAG